MLYGRIRETPNGILIGRRKFTPKELDQYCKNMYGEHWRTFRLKKHWSSLSPEERRDHGVKVRDSLLAIYGESYYHKLGRLSRASSKAYTDMRKATAAAIRPENRAKATATRARMASERGFYNICKETWYWLIDDIDFMGLKYEHLDAIKCTHPDFQRLVDLQMLASYKYLEPEEQRLVYNATNRLYNTKRKVKAWLASRPDIVFRNLYTVELGNHFALQGKIVIHSI